MEDEFKKVFDVLNNFLEIIGSNNGIIDEDLLNEHSKILFSLLGSISIQTENGLFTSYFFEKILFNRKIMLSLFKGSGVINNNKYITDSMMQYINYVLDNSNLISFLTKIEDIDICFDEFGPTEKLYKKAFTTIEIFYGLFKENNKYLNKFEERYDCSNYIIKYLKFVKSYSLFDILLKYVKNTNDVVNYYNALGATEKLYSLALFNPNLFKILFKNNDYLSVCNFSNSIDNYIKFARINDYIITHIKSIDDINKFFDEKGITKELYLIGLFDKYYFNNMYNDYTYRNICNYSIEIEKYIQFVKENNIMFDFIKDVKEIEMYFDENGATISLKNYLKENKNVTLTILNSAVHNNQILNNLGYDFVDIFEEFIKDNYFNNVDENESEKNINIYCKI